MDRRRLALVVIIGILVLASACATQPERIIETVIVEVTSIPEPTEVPEINMDSFREYTQTIFEDMYGSCVGLSRKDWATTDFTLSLLLRADAEKCVRLISTHEIPINCEYNLECNQLSSLALEYTTFVTDGWILFRKGEDTLNDDLVSEGLGMFWDAGEMWIEIIEVIHDLEDKYGWEIN